MGTSVIGGFEMERLFCLGAFLVVLAGDLAGQAQAKAPPKDFTNSIGMRFVWIPPGSFMMGSPTEEKLRGENETQHQVTLTKGFYLGIYLVTQDQWQTVMGNNPSAFKGEKNLPVENVSWEDCQVFLEKLRKKEGHAYRLPTEAEWEFACRAGTTTPYHFGETISTDQANFDGNPDGKGRAGAFRNKTTHVGSFPANPWGLFDMHGNLWQWCADVYADYPQNAVVDPKGPFAEPSHVSGLIDKLSSPVFAERQAATKALKEIGLPALPALRKAEKNASDPEANRRITQIVVTLSEIQERRVLRGGSFYIRAAHIRSAYRYSYVPTIRDLNIGFRVAMSLSTE
jgi:formylglycine-generating enzyme required for sulfatase activity